MENLKEKKPQIALLESLRSIGYNFNSALADIIDNSIAAKAKNIDIYLVESIPAIVICDDGFGMNQLELDIAMDLGSKSPEEERSVDDLGRFGLGLKSASFSQCKILTVSSMRAGIINSMTWDLNIVQKKKEWLINVNDETKISNLPYINTLKSYKHGTIVQWECFDRISKSNVDVLNTLENNLKEAAKYLALVFHKYLVEKKIKIRINNNDIPVIDPFLSKRVDTQKLKTEELMIRNGKGENCLVSVTPYILPFFKNLSAADVDLSGGKENLRSGQGFYIYRNKRLIIWGSWLHMVGMNELYRNARIEVNIPNSLDDIWEVDVKKASASIPGVIKNQLFSAVKKAIGTSKRIYKKRGTNTSEAKGYEVIWNVSEERDTYDFKINRNLPIIQQLKSAMLEEQTALFDVLLSNIENNLPKMKIFTSVAETKEKTEDDNNKDEIIDQINNILVAFKDSSTEQQIDFLNQLFQSEPYCLYPEIYDEICENLKKEDD